MLYKGDWLDGFFPKWRKVRGIGNKDSIVLRIPNNTLTVKLVEQVGPLAITSANPTGDNDIIDWASMHYK